MSISDTKAAQKYASICEVSAAQVTAVLQEALKAPEYTDEAKGYAQEAKDASQQAQDAAGNAASNATEQINDQLAEQKSEFDADQVERKAAFDADQDGRVKEFNSDQQERKDSFSSDQQERKDEFSSDQSIRNEAFDSQITGQKTDFEQFLLNSGYQFIGDYEKGPFQFTARNQYIRYNNQYYRLNASTSVGFTTTGITASSFANDVSHFVLMDGDVLRQEIYGAIPIYASIFGFSGLVDESDLWVSFCADSRDKIVDIDIKISKIGQLPDKTKISCSNGATINITANIVTSGSNQGQCISAGNSCVIDAVRINGNGFTGAGVAILSKDGVSVRNCDITNSNSVAIRDYKSTGGNYSNNHIYNTKHGIQFWLSKNGIAAGNYIHNISWENGNNGGGIFTAVATDILVYGNNIHDCNDVGIDFEGGYNCVSYGNNVRRCKNGELTIFATGNEAELTGAGVVMGNLTHKCNNVVREGFAYDRHGNKSNTTLTDIGAIMIYGGLDLNQSGPIVFDNNNIIVEENASSVMRAIASRTSTASGTANIVISNNKFITKSTNAMMQLLDRQDISITNNHFIWDAVGVKDRSEIKDHRSEYFKSNIFEFSPRATFVSDSVIFVNTTINVTGRSSFENNTFKGLDQTWIHADQAASGRPVRIISNEFIPVDASGLKNNPLNITAGNFVYQNQRFYFSLSDNTPIDFSSKNMFKLARYFGSGEFCVSMGGAFGPIYPFYIKNVNASMSASPLLESQKSNGAANTGVFPDPARYATFSGSSITASDTNPSIQNTAKCSITLDYFA